MGAGDSKPKMTAKKTLSSGTRRSVSDLSRARSLKNIQNPWTYFELCVSPGFDAEIPRGMPQKECQDEGLVSRYFLNGAHFIGVFDGHGKQGKQAARYVAHQLPMQIMASQPCSPNLQQAFINACRRVNASLLSPECGFDCSMSGTTACFAMLKGKELLLGNVGDSKAIVARQGPGGPQDIQGVPLTEDHKPNAPAEKERILQLGGRVEQMCFDGVYEGPYRVYLKERRSPGLAMSRSLGDGVAETVGVIADPTCTLYTVMDEDMFLIFASDGLWDVFSVEEAATWAWNYMQSSQKVKRLCVTQALAEEAQRRWIAMYSEAVVDDTTILLVRFHASQEALAARY